MRRDEIPSADDVIKIVSPAAASNAARDMKAEIESALNLIQLERYLKRLRRYGRGYDRATWISDIRRGLGMTSTQLARRMKVSQSSLAGMERSERRGTINIASLRRAAEAMGCTLTYAILPPASMSDTRARQRRRLAEQRLQAADPDFKKRDFREWFYLMEAEGKKIGVGELWE